VVRFAAGADLCTRSGAVGCGRGVCAHGEDQLWGHSGADRVVVSARVTLDRAHRFGSRRGRAGGVESCSRAAVGGRPSRVGSRCRGPTRFGAFADHLHAGSASVGRPVPRLRRARVRQGHRRGRSVPPTGVRADHRTDQQARLVARARRDRCGRPVVSDTEPPTARVRQRWLPSSTFESLRRSRRARSGVSGALRREHPVLRNRRR
jgi:hypothetical protein